jgi:hypothetical protein
MPTGLQAPDDQLYVVGLAKFVQFIEDRELPRPPGELPPGPELILLVKPDGEWLATTPRADVLFRYWRLLARAAAEARVRRALPVVLAPRAHAGTGHTNGDEAAAVAAVRAAIASRIDRVGRGTFNEARQVLVRERRLHGAAATSDLDAYVKFAAAVTELRYFAPRCLSHVFPSIHNLPETWAVIEEDVGADLVSSVRPAGAPDLPTDEDYQAMEPPAAQWGWWTRFWRWLWPGRRTVAQPLRAKARKRPEKPVRKRMVAAADRAADLGNNVRAAILKARAYRGSEHADLRIAPGQASRELDRLTERLQAALELTDEQTGEWRDALRPLLGPAAAGSWNA